MTRSIGASKFGFRADEFEANRITAYVAVWHDPASEPYFAGDFPGGGYGITWAGRGDEGVMYGAGTSYGPAPLLAYGSLRLLKEFPGGDLHVYAHKELENFIGEKGHARKARKRGGMNSAGDRMRGFELFEPLMDALDAGKWTLHPIDKTCHARPYNFAKSVMCKNSREALSAFKKASVSPFPRGRQPYAILLER